MTLKHIPVDELTEYENNPRMNDKAVDAVAQSISTFGFRSPIIIDKHNIIIAGHTRLKAARKLGLTTVPCIVADDLTPEQVKAFRLADNKVSELAEWDIDKLMQELSELTAFDMDAFGFDSLPEMAAECDDFSVDDEYKSIEVPTAQTNDIWQLGDHRLICGDCTDNTVLDRLTNGCKVDLLLTDPPYNVAVENSNGLTIENDNMTDEHFKAFLSSAFTAADGAMKPGAGFYIWHGETEGLNFRNACKAVGWDIRQCLIWVKNQIIMGRQDYQWKHEPCLYGWKGGASHYFIKNRKQSTVIDHETDLDFLSADELKEIIRELTEPSSVLRVDKPQKNADHPTMKPVKLIKQQIKNSTKQNGIVLDIFGGSGTTLIACEELDRACYMVELDKRYCDVIIKRYEALTGKKAILIS